MSGATFQSTSSGSIQISTGDTVRGPGIYLNIKQTQVNVAV